MEVDFILYGAGGMVAIEVKRTSRLRAADLSGLKAFKSGYPMAKTILLYGGKERLRVGDVHCVPCEDFLRILRPGMDWGKVI